MIRHGPVLIDIDLAVIINHHVQLIVGVDGVKGHLINLTARLPSDELNNELACGMAERGRLTKVNGIPCGQSLESLAIATTSVLKVVIHM